MDLQADGPMAAEEVDRILVVPGGLRIPGPLPADDRQEQTSHRNHRSVQRLVALLTAGLLVAACSGDGRLTVSQPVAPASTATTMTRTLTPASKVPTTTPPRSAPATTTAADRLAAQLTTAESAIRNLATPPSKLPALGHSQQRAYRALVRQPRLVPKVLGQLPPALRRVVQANVVAGSELRKLNGPAGRLPRWRIVAPAPAGQLLTGLRDRGLDVARPILVVIDGAKGYAAPWSTCSAIQSSNAASSTSSATSPTGSRTRSRPRSPSGCGAPTTRLTRSSPRPSWRHWRGSWIALIPAPPRPWEGLAETLTIGRLGVPPTLARTLRSTNAIESMIEICRDHAANVKRWRDGQMVLRWSPPGWVRRPCSSVASMVACTCPPCGPPWTPPSPLSHRPRRMPPPDHTRPPP
jgi:hypothetical protein